LLALARVLDSERWIQAVKWHAEYLIYPCKRQCGLWPTYLVETACEASSMVVILAYSFCNPTDWGQQHTMIVQNHKKWKLVIHTILVWSL